MLCCSTTTLSSSPQGPDGIRAAETPGTWPWSCPCVISSRDLFLVTAVWIVVRSLLVLQPTSLRILTDASVFSPSPETRLWGQFSYLCLLCFGILCGRVSRGVSPPSSFPVVCILHHFVTLSCLLVSIFLLVLSWSICHFSSVVHAPSSPASSLPLVPLLFLSFIFFPPSVGTSFFDSPPPPPTLYSAVICDFGKEHIYWGGISPWQHSRWWLLINLAFFFSPDCQITIRLWN